MTLKISFFKLVRDEYRKLAWLTALQALVFGFLIPFRVMMVLSVITSSNRDAQTETAVRLKRLTEVFWAQIGFGHLENTVFVLAAGAVCALCAFGYLHSSVRLDFFHSLPLKRETLFAVRALSSALTFLFPYVICQLLGLLAGIPYGVEVSRGAIEQLGATAQGILFFLASYAGTLLAVMLTGKMLTTVLAVGVLGGYIPLIWLLFIVLVEYFMPAHLMGSGVSNPTHILKYSSPWAACVVQSLPAGSSGQKDLTGYWPDSSGVSVLILMTVALFLICILLYRMRRTERAGSALAFHRTEMPVKLALVIPSAVAAGAFGYELLGSMLWALFFVVLFGAIFSMIMEFIYRIDIRQVLGHKAQMVLSILAAALILCGFRYDLFKYNTYLPDMDEIAAMAVQDLNGAYGYREDGGWLNDGRETLDYLETDQFEPLYRIAENGVAMEGGGIDDEETYWYVNVKYHLKNGKEIYREYRVQLDVLTENMDQMFADESYRERYYPILAWDDRTLEEMELDQVYLYCTVPVLQVDTEEVDEKYLASDTGEYSENYVYQDVSFEEAGEIRELLEAYQSDLKEMSYRDCLYADGWLQLYIWSEDDMDNAFLNYPVNMAFEKTMRIFREKLEKIDQAFG